MPTTEDTQRSRAEMAGRVIYSLLGPAVRLARTFSISLKDVGVWLELAYFRELRTDGMTLTEIGERLGVSRRKAANLSRMLKENFFAPEREQELSRRIEFMVWADPMSRARLHQTLDSPSGDIEEALEKLLDEGRIVASDGRSDTFKIARGESRLVKDSWLNKIDALNHLLSTVTNAVYARFFEGEEKALARNLQLRVRPEDLGQLRELYEEHIWPTLRDLDARAKGDRHSIPMDVSVAWAPNKYVEHQMDESDDS